MHIILIFCRSYAFLLKGHDTMHDVINVKHIIPLDLKMCQLRSGGNQSIDFKYIHALCI